MEFFTKSLNNLGSINPKSLSLMLGVLALSGCGGDGGGFDFTTVPSTGSGSIACALTNSTPLADTFKVSALGTTLTVFTVGLTKTSCDVIYSLNGVTLSGTSAAKTIASASMIAGSNTVIATVGTTTRTWSVYKNTLPDCSSQTPAAMGNTMSPGNSMILTGYGNDSDGDALSFAWKVNNNSVASSVLNTFNGMTSSQATFTPTTSFLGANNITLDINDGTDVTSCSWTVGVAGSCSIASTTPTAPGPVRVAYNAGTTSLFQVGTDPGCLVTWSLNAVTLSGIGMSQVISSSDLMIGSNLLQVTVTNGTSTDSKTWAVVKNSPPNCASQTPGITGNTVGVSSSITLNAFGSDLNNDALTYSWKNNGSPVNTSYFAITGDSSHSQAIFSPNSSFVGTNTVRADISDGYDTTACSWTVAVVPTCQVLSTTPSSITPRIPFNATTSNSFVAVANDPSCAVSWTLNGAALGGSSPFQNLTSSQFTAGPATNTLVAHFSNGFSTADQTWTVTRNTPPTCDTQVPAASGSSVGVNAPIVFTANVLDANSDPVTFTWRSNGNPANPAQFSTNAAGLTAHATFTPNAGYVGANTITADFSDGYDSASCTWNVNVVNNCSVSSSNPPTATVKIANAASTTSTFFVSPSDSSCAVSWTLNGGTVPGSQVLPLLSSDFLDGPTTNSLVATLNNGYTTPITRVWTVTKNRLPVCASQTPVTNPAAMPYQTTKNFTANASDPDGDSLSAFTWTYNGTTSGTLFNPINTVGAQSVATFKPTLTQVGVGQTIVASFNDGLDSGSCTWGFDIVDPNTVNITSCTPTSNPVIVNSTGPLSTQILTANATGNGLSYQWFKNSTVQTGFTNPTFSISSASLPVGIYTFQGLVTDAYNNSQHCDWNVKVNAPPVINALVPVANQTWKLNYNSSLAFSVTATDGNSDTLTYAWTLDGVASATLPSNLASTTFSPNGTLSLIGAHTVTVTVSDGSESATQTWNVEVNYFSNDCNTLMNSSVATAGGNICTLVGIPTMGNGNTPSADQTQMRIRPSYTTDDGAGNLIFSDQLNNTVNYFNRSGSNISRFGITIPAGKMVAVLGNGANGVTPDNLYRTAFKLNSPMDVAYDATSGRLYVADYTNHRVVMMDNTGLVTTVFGITGSAANSLAANTDGAIGTSHGCGNPVGLRLISFGGEKWLYVACSGTHVIKRMNADTSSGNYGKGYIVIGRLSATNTTTAANVDGVAGPAGDAYVNQPWALSDDGAGNLYFTESAGTQRVRMVTTGGSAMSFFTSARTVSGAVTIAATDMTVASPLTAATFNTQAIVPVGPETQVTIDGTTSAITGSCVQLRARILNAANSTTNLSGANTIVLGGAGAGGGFYSDTTCLTALGGGVNLPMTTGQSEAVFYYKKTSAGSVTLTSTGTGLTQFPAVGGKVVLVGATGTVAKLSLTGPGNYDYSACAKLTVQIQTAGGQASVSGAIRTIRMSNSATGMFYTDSACATTPTVRFTMAATDSELIVYYARNVVAPAADTVISLFGNANTNSVFPTTVGTPTSVGSVTLRYPRGLAVYAPAGVVKGFFVNSWDQYRTLFVNNMTTGSLTFGGANVPAQQAGVVLGTGTGGFNADGLGTTSRTYTGYGLNLNAAGDTILFPDYDNYRLRTFDISTNNGTITTLIGAGRARAGNLGDSPTPATSMYLNGPSQIAVDSTGRKLYISDSGNGRIRRTDLLTGSVDTIIGKGIGAATVEDEDPTNVLMQSPRSIALLSSGGVNFLAYADQASNTAANSDCMIRAMNLSVTTNATGFFGQSISKGRVDTLGGNYVKGCLQWNAGTPNTNGMAATDAQLYNPEGLASDGTNLYISLYNDHCIAKIGPTGTISQAIGTCGTAGVLDGNTTVATITSPMSIVVDPSYSADGNFFFTDAPASNPSRVRYVNYRTSSVTIGSSTVPAAPGGGVGIVQTLWTISPSGNSAGYINGLAAFSNQFCMAGGLQGNGGAGSHNVTCYDRASPLGPVTLRVGPNEATGTPTRGGAPLDLTQENAYSGSASLNAPYGIAFDTSGNLYISERNNHIVRFVRRWW